MNLLLVHNWKAFSLDATNEIFSDFLKYGQLASTSNVNFESAIASFPFVSTDKERYNAM